MRNHESNDNGKLMVRSMDQLLMKNVMIKHESNDTGQSKEPTGSEHTSIRKREGPHPGSENDRP